MRRLLFASDLDNTLLFSHRHARSGDICVERLEGREQGFMTPWVWETLGRLPEGVRLLPVTTRSIEQYRRIRWPEGHAPEYAVTTNGGIFLGPKGLDPAWLAASRALVEAWQEELARMYAWLPERPWCLRRKMVDGLYLFAVCPEETDMKAAAAECRRTAALAAEPSGRKLYLLPPGLDKGTAVEKACGFFDADVLICAGDSSLDLPMLRLADLARVCFDSGAESGGSSFESFRIYQEWSGRRQGKLRVAFFEILSEISEIYLTRPVGTSIINSLKP